MIQLAIAGAAGRMGQSLVSACEAHESFVLAHAFEPVSYTHLTLPTICSV